jgi:hypothetical protein
MITEAVPRYGVFWSAKSRNKMSDYSGVDWMRTRVIMGLSRRCIGAVPSASLALLIVGFVIASLRRALPRACGGFLLAPW